ncbi:MAG: Nif3-like dinuclear metal center hexameric protein [Fibrobacter sp.]|jgi:dinuclear metal center YbgI/SA1388 family protein|nr:Nif3-like dinuclear metal center hexameric protein [Fibrobacter sp.]
MELRAFSDWLARLLVPEKFKDYCPNGLCAEASGRVTKVMTGVSFRETLVDRAVEEGADTLIVHHPHGFWNGDDKLPVGAYARKLGKLMKHGISLYGFHLPLDGHPEIGNNAQIARLLGVRVTGGFMKEGENFVGCLGEFEKTLSPQEFLTHVSKTLPECNPQPFFNGTQEIKRIAICSGGGSSGIPEAINLGADVYFTGEIKEYTPILLEEERFNLIAGGHHRTEIFGVRALAEKIEKELGIPARFENIDNPV